jgi:hypothetical protein
VFIELLDQLRCTNEHEDSWLVAAFHRRDDRYILDATLGCHICFREYPLVNGVAYFGVTPDDHPRPLIRPDEELAMRAAAFLNARERSTLVLGGAWGDQAHGVAALLPMRLFALDPVGAPDDSEQVSVIRSSQGISLAPASVDGVALDPDTATAVNLRSAVRVLRPGGRLLAPVGVPVPEGIGELARDENYWVGEAALAVIPLARRRS